MRLDKLLGMLSVSTRSTCPGLLRSGRVSVDGELVRDPSLQVTEKSTICLDGKPLDTRLSRYLMMNKPAGILTAAQDRKSRTVMDLLPPLYHSLGCMPVGRLDKDTTGLLLFTTNGDLAHRLISPKHHVQKVYRAEVEGKLDQQDIEAFEKGIELKDFTCLPAGLQIDEDGAGIVTVYEGKYHQVKRMFGSRGKPVTALQRITFGPFTLPQELAEGEWRELTKEEAALLLGMAGMENIE